MPSGMVMVSEQGFRNYGSLGAVGVSTSSGLRRVGRRTFREAPIARVRLPRSIGGLKHCTFTCYARLARMALPGGGATFRVRGFMFANYSTLRGVGLPASLASVPRSTFDGYVSLGGIALPKTLARLKRRTFGKYARLAGVAVPKAVASFCDSMFTGSKLARMAVGGNVQRVKRGTFRGAPLADVAFPGAVAHVDKLKGDGVAGVRFTRNTRPARVTRGTFCKYGVTAFGVPTDMAAVGRKTFRCDDVRRVAVPRAMAAVRSHYFGGYGRLAGIALPAGVARLPGDVFKDYSGLGAVRLPLGLRGVKDCTFHSDKVGTVRLPRGLGMVRC